jgi:hypothetical protein
MPRQFNFAINMAQRELFKKVQKHMEDELFITLSKASVVERLLKMYIRDHPEVDPVYLRTEDGIEPIPSFLTTQSKSK